MKTINSLIVMALLCLIVNTAFAGNPSTTNPKPANYKEIRFKVKLPNRTDYCYVAVFADDEGPVVINGQSGHNYKSYIELQDANGIKMTAYNNIDFILGGTLGPDGSTTVTHLDYTISTGNSDSSIIDNIFVQRDLTIYAFDDYGASPTNNGAYTISMNGALIFY